MILTSKSIRSCLLSTCLILLPILFFTACISGKTEPKADELFPVISPLIKDTVYVREYVADIHSLQNTELRARAAGYLETIHVDEGDYVKAGQLLFSISRQQYQHEVVKAEAALASARAEVKAAEVDLKNTQALVTKNIVSQSELDRAMANVDALKAKTEEALAQQAAAQLQFSFTQIKAPFSGYINRIPNKIGSLIEEGELLTTISNNTEMLVYFYVSEREYLEYTMAPSDQRLNEVVLVLANGQVYELNGKVETVESEVDKATGSIAFRARFRNPSKILKHGSSGKILVRSQLKDVLLIPQKSTFEVQENIYVFVVTEGNIIQQRKIVPSFRLPQLYVISAGLTATDKFVYEGIQKLKEGDVIVPESVNPDSYQDLSVNPTN